METVSVGLMHVQTECLHDATVCPHSETVCVHKSVATHARARVNMTLYKVCAPLCKPTIPTVYLRCLLCMHTISLFLHADSQMIGPPQTPVLGNKLFNNKLIRSSQEMDALAAKSDAVTAWEFTWR